MNNNIMLITCSVEDESRSPEVQFNSHYPLGLAYIHSYLEQYGFVVETLFLNDYAYGDCLRIIAQKMKEFKPSIVGLQIIAHNRVMSFRAIEYLKNEYPEVPILVGGVHVSVMYKQILEKYPFLITVIGEGELTMLELIQNLTNGLGIELVKGIAFVKNAKIVRTAPRNLIENLDWLPFPKHKIFFSEKRSFASIMTSRGCPFNCSFCVLGNITKRKVRYRSVKNVVDEIECLANSFNKLKTIWIHDDSFFLQNDRAIEICNEIVRRNIKLKFVCSAKFKPISKELISALEQAGFTHVLFGLESGSAKILKSCHKQITPQEIERAIELFKNSPIEIAAFLIVGLPGEDYMTIKETARLIQKLQKIKYFVFDEIGVLSAYPGTEVYDIAKSKGIIDDSFWMTDQPVPFFTAEHSQEQLFVFKKLLLSHISIKKLFTFDGFIAQLPMFPYLLMNHPRLIIGEFLSYIKRATYLGKLARNLFNE